MKKLGPTSKLYDFKHKVRFVINQKPEAVGRIKYDHPEWYEIDFEYKDDDYQIVADLFDLKNRYNLENSRKWFACPYGHLWYGWGLKNKELV